MARALFKILPVKQQDYVSIICTKMRTPTFRVYREWSLIEGFGTPGYFIYFSLFTCSFVIGELE